MQQQQKEIIISQIGIALEITQTPSAIKTNVWKTAMEKLTQGRLGDKQTNNHTNTMAFQLPIVPVSFNCSSFQYCYELAKAYGM